MNYSELSTAIQDYLQDGDATFVSHIPTFVRQAEERIYRSVLIPQLRKTDTTALVASTATTAKPTDYLAPSEFAVVDSSGTYHYLLLKDVSFIREAYPTTSRVGVPLYYAELDGTDFLLGPTPYANFATELHYYYDPESIVTASTSWLGDNAETALLYACLTEGYRFLKGDPDLMQVYNERYTEALDDLRKVGQVINRTDAYRDGEAVL